VAAQFRTGIRFPRTDRPVSLTPRQVAKTYNFPVDAATGHGYVGGIIELGGGYNAAQVRQYFAQANLPSPTLRSIEVGGGRNQSDGPDGADGEVQLDMIVSGAVAPNMTQNVYFCPNTDAGFLAGIQQARKDGCHGISISWGGPENSWDHATMQKYEQEFAACRAAGIPVFVAAGDTGAQDSSGAGKQTDFPASSPSVIGCGGTRLEVTGSGSRASETVWNDDPTTSATGGGISKVFPGRQVPDVAGNADPDTGYRIMVDGQKMVVGGTSAVAPLMLGLHALLWELKTAPFDFLNLIVTNPQACYDVTVGDNGGYRAGPGRDETTGFGVPDGSVLLAALTGGIPAPVPPTPVPPSPEPSDPVADFPVKLVTVWGQHKHNHSAIEAAAYTAIVDWAQTHGVSLPV
jgi:kumamolisin